MMTDTDRPPIQFVSQESALDVFLKLKERAVYVLALLCNSPAPLTRDQLSSLTGWSRNTVAGALTALDYHGLAVQGRERGPWSPTQSSRSLFSQQSSTVELSPNPGRGAPRGFGNNRHPGFRDSQNPPPPPAHPTYLKNLARLDRSSTVELQTGGEAQPVSFNQDDSSTSELQTGRSSTSELSNLGGQAQPLSYGSNGNGHGPSAPQHDWLKTDLRRKQRLIACRQVGINPPALTRIVENDSIDPIFIAAHAWQCEHQNKTSKTGKHYGIGALIWRIENYQSPSKEAMRHAEEFMTVYETVTCQHCDWQFSVSLKIGENVNDYNYDCPKCEREVDPTITRSQTSVVCQHCEMKFDVTLQKGETVDRSSRECPHCGQLNDYDNAQEQPQ